MICIENERNCCGCAACAEVCPANCIMMIPGTLGAVYPKVNTDKCLQCEMCDEVCPMQHAEEMKKVPEHQTVYAAYSKDPQLRKAGSSGGIFGVLATILISQDYRVYGAGFDETLQLRCMWADNWQELKPLMKSKYLQSDLSNAYSQILKDLQQGRRVLFVSTPCQITALKRYLRKDYENLLTIDFLCHGVPSQIFFNRCKAYEEEKYGKRILSYSFRTKIPGGTTPHYFTLQTEKNGKKKIVTKPYFQSTFYAFFQKYITLRESCYDCTFSERGRVSDITIGDFHDIEKYVPDINRFEGVSTVIVNTPNGESLFECAKDQLWVRPFNMQQLMTDRVLFSEKTKRPAGRDQFADDYKNMEFHSFINRHLDKKRYVFFAVYYRLPKSVRTVLRRICHIK